ncbi:acyltransferase family protein [Rhizobium wuzhouense]|uniref:Acyltransferase 3 domain-containing protein n=1 Tax=Rhizobium wuzhouense TaxID=1986026 RepID=A0ABX5NME6_9HYPH|nr:acyltransferase [Rhizobium wuzhouense]PYB71262.1 hypothetical protein DMY87_18030 [Rhizobium wuzhouense]
MMTTIDRNQGLQAARGIAALAVMYYHSHLALVYFDETSLLTVGYLANRGAFGVDLFFAISGYIVCLIAQRPSFTLPSFFAKRFSRIYPLSALVTVGIAIIAPMTEWKLFDPYSWMDLFKSLLLLPTPKPLNGVLWTLQYEICFYLVAGAIVRFFSPMWLFAYCAAASASALWMPVENVWIARFFDGRYSSFGAGVAAYLIASRVPESKIIPAIATALGLAFFHSGFRLGIPYYQAVTAFLLVFSAVSWNIRSKPLTMLGDSSYALYLFHFPFFICLNGLVWQLSPPQWTGELVRWGAMGICIAAAIASWRLFEKPINDAVAKSARGKK